MNVTSKYLIVLHQKETKTALVPQEASHYSLHWDDGCASSTCEEKLVGTAVVKRLEMQVPRKNIIILNFNFKVTFSLLRHSVNVLVQASTQDIHW